MAVLTEDAVIGYACDYLTAQGWHIVSRAMPTQHGTDIVAVRGGIRLEAEAKGAGSSKAHTARYGQPFTTAQVKVHVGEAVLKALRVVAAGQARAAIAFPVTLATGQRSPQCSQRWQVSASRSSGSRTTGP